MEQEEEWEREGLLDPAWEKQQKKVSRALMSSFASFFLKISSSVSILVPAAFPMFSHFVFGIVPLYLAQHSICVNHL
jgi:hypothetical protein